MQKHPRGAGRKVNSNSIGYSFICMVVKDRDKV